MKDDRISLARAYAQGYWDGRQEGVSSPRDSYSEHELYFYDMGYDAGVADYCCFDTTVDVDL